MERKGPPNGASFFITPVKEEKPKMIEATKDKPLEEVIAKIEKLGELREKGFLSEEEFQAQKEKLLKNL